MCKLSNYKLQLTHIIVLFFASLITLKQYLYLLKDIFSR